MPPAEQRLAEAKTLVMIGCAESAPSRGSRYAASGDA